MFAQTYTLVKNSQELSIELYETDQHYDHSCLTEYNCRLFRLTGTCMASQAKSKSMILQYYHMHMGLKFVFNADSWQNSQNLIPSLALKKKKTLMK